MEITRTAKCSSESRGFGQGRQKLENYSVFRQAFGGFRPKTATLKNPTGSFRGQNCHFFVKTANLKF